MKALTEVSETALITLRSRVLESEKVNPLIKDPMGKELLEALMKELPHELRDRILKRRLSPVLTRHIALRARKYDELCREFLQKNADGLIVSLGCGFDTRFWRLGGEGTNYVELDLPGVIGIKKQMLKDKISYPIIQDSVLEEDWISQVKEKQNEKVLFVAEGLFMYLPKDLVIGSLQRLAESFHNSALVMEVVAEKYTRGMRRKMVERKMRKGAGSTAGDYYQFGISKASELESFHEGFRVKGEWSFFEDPDLKPAFLRAFRHSKALSKTQYTVIADIA